MDKAASAATVIQMRIPTQIPGPLDVTLRDAEKNVRIRLEYADEVRFGPAYYWLWVSGAEGEYGPGQSEAFGGKATLSTESRYVALERWRRLDRPDTELVLLDLQTKQEAVLFEIEGGFADSITFGADAQGVTVKALGVRFGEQRREAVPLPSVNVASVNWRAVDWWR